MKKMIRRCLSLCLSLTLILCLTAPALAAGKATSFSDVSTGHWAYKDIMDVNTHGIMQGVAVPVNGVGKFNPEGIITRAEFNVLLARIAFPEEMNAAEAARNPGEPWWIPAFRVRSANFNVEYILAHPQEMEVPITRAEVAELLPSIVDAVCGPIPDEVQYNNAPYLEYYVTDFYSIDYSIRTHYLPISYYHGILGGDAQGNFNPNHTLTRAEAAAIANRLLNPDKRLDNSKYLTMPSLDPKTFVNTAGEPLSDFGKTGQLAGQLVPETATLTRPVYDGTESINQMCSEVTGFTSRAYMKRVFPSGIGDNDNLTNAACFVKHADGRPGVKIYGWRHDLDSHAGENAVLNVVMEMFFYLCKDREVAFALWSWKDYANVLGYANSDDFGFTDVSLSANGAVITMKGINIEVDQSVKGQSIYYFPLP